MVLLLQGRRLQHEVLLLCGVHLLQVLCGCAGLPVQGLLDHLRIWDRGQECQLATPHVLSALQSCLLNPSGPEQDPTSLPGASEPFSVFYTCLSHLLDNVPSSCLTGVLCLSCQYPTAQPTPRETRPPMPGLVDSSLTV